MPNARTTGPSPATGALSLLRPSLESPSSSRLDGDDGMWITSRGFSDSVPLSGTYGHPPVKLTRGADG